MTNKEKRQYRKMVKKYRKQLIKVAKNWDPWDYADVFTFLITCLKGMQEYYDNGINVWSYERQNDVSRLERCNRLLQLYQEWHDYDWTVDGHTFEKEEQKLIDFFTALAKDLPELWD